MEIMFDDIRTKLGGGGGGIATPISAAVSNAGRVRHHIYSATGVSGSGKTFALLKSAPGKGSSVMERVALSLKNGIAELAKTYGEGSIRLKVRVADIYGERADDDAECESEGVDASLAAGKLFVYDPDALKLPGANATAATLASPGRVRDEYKDLEDPAYMGPIVSNLTELKLRTNFGDEAAGQHRFHIRETPNNPESSRAHMMITALLETKDGVPLGKISLLDMAGTEDVAAIQSSYFGTSHIVKKTLMQGTTSIRFEDNIRSRIARSIDAFRSNVGNDAIRSVLAVLTQTMNKVSAKMNVVSTKDLHETASVIVPGPWIALLGSRSEYMRAEVTRVLECPPDIPAIVSLVQARLTIAAEIDEWTKFAREIGDTYLVQRALQNAAYQRPWNDDLIKIIGPRVKKNEVAQILERLGDPATMTELRKSTDRSLQNWLVENVIGDRLITRKDTLTSQMAIQITLRVVRLAYQDRRCRAQLAHACAQYVLHRDEIVQLARGDKVPASVASGVATISASIDRSYLTALIAPMVLPSIEDAKSIVQTPNIPLPTINPIYMARVCESFGANVTATVLKDPMSDQITGSLHSPGSAAAVEGLAPIHTLVSDLDEVATHTLVANWNAVYEAVEIAQTAYAQSEAAKKRVHCPLRRQGVFIMQSIDDIRRFVKSIADAEKSTPPVSPEPTAWLKKLLGSANEQYRFIQIAALRSDFRWTCDPEDDREMRIRDGAVDTLKFAQSVNPCKPEST
jgi:hypothetical protein